MSILGKYTKQPAEQESYSIDYVDDLIGSDAITSATVDILPIGLTLVSSLVIGTRVKVLLAGGGPVGTKHKVTVTATTEDNRILQDEFVITIKDY